jgi:uncharacterized protein (TIGR03435 family)
MLAAAVGMLAVSGRVGPHRAFAQSAGAAAPRFEVASIHPTPMPPGRRQCSSGGSTDAVRVELSCTSLIELLWYQVGIRQGRLVGPDWMKDGQKFDVSAKLPDGANPDQLPRMFQSLLEDRFGLALHRESRELPVYAIVVAKGGLKAKPAGPEAEQPAWAAAAAKGAHHIAPSLLVCRCTLSPCRAPMVYR